MYQAKVSGTIKIQYNPDIFSVYDAATNVKTNDDYTDYMFGTYTANIKPLDMFKVNFSHHDKKLQT